MRRPVRAAPHPAASRSPVHLEEFSGNGAGVTRQYSDLRFGEALPAARPML